MQNDLISKSALKKTFEDAELGEHSLIESVFAAGVYAVIDNAPHHRSCAGGAWAVD